MGKTWQTIRSHRVNHHRPRGLVHHGGVGAAPDGGADLVEVAAGNRRLGHKARRLQTNPAQRANDELSSVPRPKPPVPLGPLNVTMMSVVNRFFDRSPWIRKMAPKGTIQRTNTRK